MIDFALYLCSAAVLVYLLIVYWLTWNYNHWKNLNIPYLEPTLIFGNIKDYILVKKHKGVVYDELYKQSDEPAIGIFAMRQPQLLIRDPSLLKILTVNEFSNFRENDIYTEPNDFFLTTNVFFISGEEWKRKRGIITPALTMSKLKLFIPHMVEISRDMIKYLDENQAKALEAKDFTGLFTIETAMSYTYGVKCDSYKNPNSIFKQAFDEIFVPSKLNALKFIFATFFPTLGRFFKIGLTPKSFTEFYISVVRDAIEYKKKYKPERKDFLQFLIDSSGNDKTVDELSARDMAGLTMNLAADGTVTTSAALTQVMDALRRYPEHQTRLREEITSKIKSLEDITYENINSVPYLTAFIHESLRIMSPVSGIEKKCTTNCEISFKGRLYKFKKGDVFVIPFFSLHLDEKLFQNPLDFNPERFLGNDDLLGFIPFGSGPRACLGRPFALIQMKVFLCALLKHYEILPKGKKVPERDYDPNSNIFMVLKERVWFTLKKL